MPLLFLLILACVLPGWAPLAHAQPLNYNNLEHWVAHPDSATPLMSQFNLDIAVINPDLSTDTILPVPNNSRTNTGVDVFYVYPTLDEQVKLQRENIAIADQNRFRRAATVGLHAGQFARFGRVFAPFYRQANMATFIGPTDSLHAEILARAYRDVEAAFFHYLNNFNGGNRFVLVSHSQGSQMLAMLLREHFDNNPQLRSQLVTAVLGGHAFSYAPAGQQTGGFWENIRVCSSTNECGCVLSWRSYEAGQTIPSADPALNGVNRVHNNPALVDSGFVFKLFDAGVDRILMDTSAVSATSQPARYYAAQSGRNYGQGAGFVAFDSLYQLSFERPSPLRAGMMFEFTPAQGDQRPNEPANDIDSAMLANSGYHTFDFRLFGLTAVQQVALKLDSCAQVTGRETSNAPDGGKLKLWPNPAGDVLNVQFPGPDATPAGRPYAILDLNGRQVQTGQLSPSGRVSVAGLPAGLYLFQSGRASQRFVRP